MCWNFYGFKNEIQHVDVAILAQTPKLTNLDLGENQLPHFVNPIAYLRLNHGRSMSLILPTYLRQGSLLCAGVSRTRDD